MKSHAPIIICTLLIALVMVGHARPASDKLAKDVTIYCDMYGVAHVFGRLMGPKHIPFVALLFFLIAILLVFVPAC